MPSKTDNPASNPICPTGADPFRALVSSFGAWRDTLSASAGCFFPRAGIPGELRLRAAELASPRNPHVSQYAQAQEVSL